MARAHQFSLGNFKCIALEDSSRKAQVPNEFPQIDPQDLKSAMEKSGYQDLEVEVGANILLVDTGEKKVLIDTGRGQDHLIESLASVGIKPEDIDVVVITHGDGDHIGGIQHFLKAEFIIPQYAWEIWTSTEGMQMMIAEFVHVFEPFMPPERLNQAIQNRQVYGKEMLPVLDYQMRKVADEEEFLPGIRLISTPGHRSDHFSVEIKSEGATLIHIADAFRYCFQASHPQWHSTYDSYPEQIPDSIEKIVERGKQDHALFFAAHFSFPGLAQVESDGEMRLFCD